MVVQDKAGAIILLREVAPKIILFLLWDICIVIGFQIFHQEWMEQPELPITLLGSALALFLTLRNNAAYGRWWEARALWGSVVNHCRSLNRAIAAIFPTDRFYIHLIVAFPVFLTALLTGKKIPEDTLKKFSPDLQKAFRESNNAPVLVLYELAKYLEVEAKKAGIDGATIAEIEAIMGRLTDAQGGLERICRTPLPIHYRFLSTLGTNLFCFILPLSAVQTLGWFTPLGATAAGAVFQMFNRAGADLENPFSSTEHAIPMHTITRMIENDIFEKRNMQTRPLKTPVKGILD